MKHINIDTETSTTIHGEILVWRRSDGGKWVCIFGPEDAVHFFERNGTWVGKRPFSIEPLATAKTLADCVLKVKKHYQIRQAQHHERMAAMFRRLSNDYVR